MRRMDDMDRQEIETLGRYNAERSRGLTHDSEYAERMEQLQRRFDARMAQLDTDAAYIAVAIEFERRTALPRWLCWLAIVVAVISMVVLLAQAIGGHHG